MLIFNIRAKILFSLIMLLLWGCMPPVVVRENDVYTAIPVTVRLANYNTILIDVSSELPEASQMIVKLENAIIEDLNSRKTFENIISASTSQNISADLRLNAKIIETKLVVVELIDLKTGKNNGVFRVDTAFWHPFHLSVQDAARLITDFIIRNM